MSSESGISGSSTPQSLIGESSIREHSIMVPLGEKGLQQLHMRRFYRHPDDPSVFLLHGLLEDGTIYYSRTGQGLAYFLAEQGFQVFVPDLRGKGRSWPSVAQLLNCRVVDLVTEDIPTLLDKVESLTSRPPAFLVGHGFGGVLISSFLARYPEYRHAINGVVHFGSRRVAAGDDLYRRIMIDWLWSGAAGFIARIRGVIPGRLLKIGAKDEHWQLHEDSLQWLQGSPWQDPDDAFDYGKALSQGLEYPPSLYFASRKDLGYGNPADVRNFMREVGHHNGRLVVLGKAEGNRHNYSHIGMLIHPDARDDHFPFMLEWLVEMLSLKVEAQCDSEPESSAAAIDEEIRNPRKSRNHKSNNDE
ncbi:MAG: alpha/beta fold hydrolase [Ketobacteraceae bacterium]|nr:alpha/beta fold hydrolase [Ketobacteraceae bacterium]